MCTEDEDFPDEASEEPAAPGTPIERVAAALGQPVAIFTDGVSVEPRLSEAVELLRLWARLRDPASARRVLDFLAAVVAEQDRVASGGAGGDAAGRSGDGWRS